MKAELQQVRQFAAYGGHFISYVIDDPYRLIVTAAIYCVCVSDDHYRLYLLINNAVSSACSSKCVAVCAIFFYLVCMVEIIKKKIIIKKVSL